jgi:hypothetical protein
MMRAVRSPNTCRNPFNAAQVIHTAEFDSNWSFRLRAPLISHAFSLI